MSDDGGGGAQFRHRARDDVPEGCHPNGLPGAYFFETSPKWEGDIMTSKLDADIQGLVDAAKAAIEESNAEAWFARKHPKEVTADEYRELTHGWYKLLETSARYKERYESLKAERALICAEHGPHTVDHSGSLPDRTPDAFQSRRQSGMRGCDAPTLPEREPWLRKGKDRSPRDKEEEENVKTRRCHR